MCTLYKIAVGNLVYISQNKQGSGCKDVIKQGQTDKSADVQRDINKTSH